MIAALICATTWSAAAWAAGPAGNTPAENNTGLEEIVVTAEKRESTVQATPISITALSAADLAQENIENIQDLVGKVPGISLRTAGPVRPNTKCGACPRAAAPRRPSAFTSTKRRSRPRRLR